MGLNKPVNFEIAKLLKEKGFPQPKTIKETEELGLLFNWYNEDGVYNGTYKLSTTIHASTIAEVVMWLYEKHGIWIECLHRGDMGDFTFKVSKLKKGWRTEPHYIHENGFNSPTEAYEVAIEYTLNNLI